jgi:hypothetical protein
MLQLNIKAHIELSHIVNFGPSDDEAASREESQTEAGPDDVCGFCGTGEVQLALI